MCVCVWRGRRLLDGVALRTVLEIEAFGGRLHANLAVVVVQDQLAVRDVADIVVPGMLEGHVVEVV